MYEFYYQSLSDKEKRLYDNLLKGVKYQYTSVFVSFRCNDKEIGNVFKAVLYDHPELFYLKLGWRYSYGPGGTEIVPEYTYKLDEVAEIEKRLHAKFDRVFSRIIKEKDEFAKVLMVHDYIRYDKDDDTSFNVLGPFFTGHSACQGIAMMAKYLFDYIGIKSIFIFGKAVGEGHSDGHAWNKVQVNGNWYNIDITFDLRVHGCLQYAYFNITDKELKADHVIETKNSPECNSQVDNYFYHQGLVFASVGDAANYFNERMKIANFCSFRLKDASKTDHSQEILDLIEWDVKRGFVKASVFAYLETQTYTLIRNIK